MTAKRSQNVSGIQIYSDKKKRRKSGQPKQQEEQQVREECRLADSIVHSNDSSISLKDLGLSSELQALCHRVGIVEPTPIQSTCIPAILSGRDVIGIAETGSGKTAAFALPIIYSMGEDPYGVFALMLTPTRELAIQTEEQLRILGADLTFRVAVIIGGKDQITQSLELQKRPHIVVATPGRLFQVINSNPDLSNIFKRLKFLVLDEVDRLLDKSLQSDMKNLLQMVPSDRQTLLFSATMSQAMIKLHQNVLRDAFTFQAYTGLKTVEHLVEQYMFVPEFVRDATLFYILDNLQEEFHARSAVIFCSAPQACYLLQRMLKNLSIESVQLHASLPQRIRTASLSLFKQGRAAVMLSTDVGSRGLDIPSVDLVINYDIPMLAKDYVHRVGRTARAGRAGRAITFLCNQRDQIMIQKIEKLVGHALEEFSLNDHKIELLIGKVKKAKTRAGVDIITEEVKETSSYNHRGKREKKDWLSL